VPFGLIKAKRFLFPFLGQFSPLNKEPRKEDFPRNSGWKRIVRERENCLKNKKIIFGKNYSKTLVCKSKWTPLEKEVDSNLLCCIKVFTEEGNELSLLSDKMNLIIPSPSS